MASALMIMVMMLRVMYLEVQIIEFLLKTIILVMKP